MSGGLFAALSLRALLPRIDATWLTSELAISIDMPLCDCMMDDLLIGLANGIICALGDC